MPGSRPGLRAPAFLLSWRRYGGDGREGGDDPLGREAAAGAAATGGRMDGGATPAVLDELAATCNVKAAVRAAGMKPSGVYKLRRRSAAFRALWAEALREGYARLELALLDRALNGTVKTVRRSSGAVDRTREYPNSVAISLLKMHRESAAAAEAVPAAEELEEVRRRVLRKLSAAGRRLAGDGEA